MKSETASPWAWRLSRIGSAAAGDGLGGKSRAEVQEATADRSSWVVRSQTLRDKGLEADYSLELQSWWVGWFFPSEDIKTRGN